MTYRRWTEDEEGYLERFVYDAEERNSTLQEVSETLGIPIKKVRSKIHWMRKEKGYKKLYVRKRYTKKEEQFIRDHYPHLNTVYIAERLDRSVDQIRDKAKRMGVRKSIPISMHDKEIRRMASDGHFISEIAKKLGVNQSSLNNYIRLNKIKCEVVPIEIRTHEIRKYNSIIWINRDRK